jgi:hypothetical protein
MSPKRRPRTAGCVFSFVSKLDRRGRRRKCVDPLPVPCAAVLDVTVTAAGESIGVRGDDFLLDIVSETSRGETGLLLFAWP